MKLDESLERLATRGPVRDPGTVINDARHTSSLSDGTDAEVISLTSSRDVARGRRLLAVAAAVAVVAAGAAGVMSRRDHKPIVFSESTAEPSPPIALNSAERDTAIARCGGSPLAGSIGVADSRPEGLLVGQITGDVWATCLFASNASTSVSTIAVRGSALNGRTTPIALVGEVSPTRPIVVVDANPQTGTDGPTKQIDGTEVTWVWGQIDPSIATVVVSTRSGRYIPTITNGLFAASWRGNNGDETIVRGFDSSGNEIAFVDQLNCFASEPVQIGTGIYTPPTRRLVVRGEYVEGGCRGGKDAKPGATADEIGDGR
jgi:hypothetical protein